jgi:predicted deacylase
MPGKPHGIESQVYAYRLMERIVRHFDILLDLHTASFGRVNSLYVRADMRSPDTAELARWVGPQIIVHNEGADGTLRGAAADRGIRAITIEIGNPQSFSRRKIKASRIGARDVLEHLGMVPPDEEVAVHEPVECERSYWLYTDSGGVLEVMPDPVDTVEANEPIAYLSDPWGQRIRTYRAPEAGIVVGKSTNPVATTGSRILHLGIVAR